MSVDIQSDGGTFARLRARMATGSGKTVVMVLVVAWQVLNNVANPSGMRLSKHVLIVAPGLTIQNRLVVREPSHPENDYEAFLVVPPTLLDEPRRGNVKSLLSYAAASQNPGACSARSTNLQEWGSILVSNPADPPKSLRHAHDHAEQGRWQWTGDVGLRIVSDGLERYGPD